MNIYRRLMAATAVTLLIPGSPAYAGPSKSQPASFTISAGEARKVALSVMEDQTSALPGPRASHVGACPPLRAPNTPVGRVRTCAVSWRGGDTTCTADMWTWESHRYYFYEFHNLNCS